MASDRGRYSLSGAVLIIVLSVFLCTPGHYEFQSKAMNSEGVSTEGYYCLGFIIIPAYWKRLGFKIGFAADAGLINNAVFLSKKSCFAEFETPF